MTFEEFHNGLRLLNSIDASELGDPEWWPDFQRDPYRFMVRCSDEDADVIWRAMKKRGAVKQEEWDAEDLEIVHKMIPDLYAVMTRNPVTQVYFRAGLLACREYMARFVEQGGNKDIAQSIRANWWPQLGEDPGPPRRFDFAEVCEESDGPDGKPVFKSLDIPPNVEALPRAFVFLMMPAIQADDSTDGRQS